MSQQIHTVLMFGSELFETTMAVSMFRPDTMAHGFSWAVPPNLSMASSCQDPPEQIASDLISDAIHKNDDKVLPRTASKGAKHPTSRSKFPRS